MQQQLLFVCRANLIRSPLAEAFTRRLLPPPVRSDLEVSSCGLQVVSGTVPGDRAVSVGWEHGVDLEQRSPVPVTRRVLGSADLVVTMTEAQRSHVCRMTTGLVARAFTLVELCRLLGEGGHADLAGWTHVARVAHAARPLAVAPHEPEDVPDPIGRSLHEHRLVAAGVEALCQDLVGRVRHEPLYERPPAPAG